MTLPSFNLPELKLYSTFSSRAALNGLRSLFSRTASTFSTLFSDV